MVELERDRRSDLIVREPSYDPDNPLESAACPSRVHSHSVVTQLCAQLHCLIELAALAE